MTKIKWIFWLSLPCLYTLFLTLFFNGAILRKTSVAVSTPGNMFTTKPVYGKSIIIIIDALREDSLIPHSNQTSKNIKYHKNKFPRIEKLLKDYPKNSRLYSMKTEFPSSTPKCIATIVSGSIQSFASVGTNLGERILTDDNIIDQLLLKSKSIAAMGDIDWGIIFPDSYAEHHFNGDDDSTVYNNIFSALLNRSIDVVIAHLLEFDSFCHSHTLDDPQAGDPLERFDKLIRKIIETIGNDSILFVLGDHSATLDGTHSSDQKESFSSALFVYSPRELPGVQQTTFVHQIDFASTFSYLMGINSPLMSIGFPIGELLPENMETTSGIPISKNDIFRQNEIIIQHYLDSLYNVSGVSSKSWTEISEKFKKIEDLRPKSHSIETLYRQHADASASALRDNNKFNDVSIAFALAGFILVLTAHVAYLYQTIPEITRGVILMCIFLTVVFSLSFWYPYVTNEFLSIAVFLVLLIWCCGWDSFTRSAIFSKLVSTLLVVLFHIFSKFKTPSLFDVVFPFCSIICFRDSFCVLDVKNDFQFAAKFYVSIIISLLNYWVSSSAMLYISLGLYIANYLIGCSRFGSTTLSLGGQNLKNTKILENVLFLFTAFNPNFVINLSFVIPIVFFKSNVPNRCSRTVELCLLFTISVFFSSSPLKIWNFSSSLEEILKDVYLILQQNSMGIIIVVVLSLVSANSDDIKSDFPVLFVVFIQSIRVLGAMLAFYVKRFDCVCFYVWMPRFFRETGFFLCILWFVLVVKIYVQCNSVS